MRTVILVGAYLVMMATALESQAAEPLRVGIIGCDTSHVPAFAKLLNSSNPKEEFAGVKVVAAFSGGSEDIPDSKNRVEGFTNELKGMGIEIVPSVDELVKRVDAVLLESVDG